jgi:adenosylmethionine---8-amino-7-oxononanoate aminotransferase
MVTPPRALAEILEADRRHVWHPYTPMEEWRRRHDPLVVRRAQGAYLELFDGRRVLDANGSWWVSTLGHNHPRLVAALCTQAQALCHVSLAGITHEPAALLAQELAAVTPRGLDQVFYGDDGSTAVEAAVKMATQFHQQVAPVAGRRKTRFLALDGAFHGETIGATSLGGVEVFRRPFASVVFDVIHVPAPTEDADALERVTQILEQRGDEIAALVIEPIVQGAAGMRVSSASYLKALALACHRHEVMLIADEVFTGYGRLGPMWACDLAEVVPDLLCTAKGFTAGVLPMSATVTSQRVLDGFGGARSRAFLYGHSYCGNPLGAAVAREVLAIYRDERVLEGIPLRAARIRAAFERMAADPVSSRLVREVRALGMMGAAELRESPSTRTPSEVPTIETTGEVDEGYTASVGWLVFDEAKARGASLRPLGNVVYVAPALNIALDDLDRLLAIVEDSVRAVAAQR